MISSVLRRRALSTHVTPRTMGSVIDEADDGFSHLPELSLGPQEASAEAPEFVEVPSVCRGIRRGVG
jgi:hypothetical protein